MPALQKTVLRPPGVGQTHGQCVHAKVGLLPLWESLSGLASGLWADMCRRHHTPPKGWEPYRAYHPEKIHDSWDGSVPSATNKPPPR